MTVGHSYRTILTIAAVLAMTAGGAFAAEQSFDAQAEIEALRAEVQQLRAQGNESWLNERRTEEVKSLIREVLSDADTRASLAEGGMTAGHNGKKFFLASEDGSFLMNIEGQIQFRWIWTNTDGDDSADDDTDSNETGFVIRRTKLKFSGHIADPKLHYEVQLEVDRASNEVVGDVILIGYDLTDTFTISVGEGKAPFLREEFTSSKRQLAVERSAVNELFTLDVVQGIFMEWMVTDNIKLSGAISDGGTSGDGNGGGRVDIFDDFSDFDDIATDKQHDNDGTDFAVTGRVDILLAGDWKQYKDFTSWPGEELFAYVGGAVHYEINESGEQTGNLDDNDPWLMWTVDGAVEYKGFNVYAAFVMAHSDFEEPGAEDYDPWGLVIQGGYNMDLGNGDSLEPFVRYERIDYDDAISDGAASGTGFDDTTDILTFGVNWYHKKHNAKFTADVVWALDPIDSDESGLGIGPDFDSDSDDQIVVRLQYQLLF